MQSFKGRHRNTIVKKDIFKNKYMFLHTTKPSHENYHSICIHDCYLLQEFRTKREKSGHHSMEQTMSSHIIYHQEKELHHENTNLNNTYISRMELK